MKLQNLKNLNDQLAKGKFLTGEEVDAFLSTVLEFLTRQKTELDNEGKQRMEEMRQVMSYIETKHKEVLAEWNSKLDTKSQKTLSDLTFNIQATKDTLNEAKTLLKEIKAVEVKDGKDADEELIVEKVIDRIKIEPDVVTLSAKDVKNKLESLKGKNKLDISAVKGFDLYAKKVDLDYAVKTLQHQTSFLINRPQTSGSGTVQSVTGLNTDNADPANPVVQISVDGVTITGAGTPGSPLIAVTGGSGDVTGPASSTDNAIARFDSTTGKIIQNSGVTISDANVITTAGTIDSSLTASQLLATNGSNQLVSLDTATYPSLTEISYVKGVTSAIQTQLNSKLGTLTVGTTTITSGTTTRILYDNAGVLGEYTITGTGTVVAMQTNPTLSGLTMTDATNIVLDTTTGTKIGTATTQKLAFYNSTPIVQPTGDVVTALQNLGLVSSATIASATNINTATESTDTTCFPVFVTASGTQTLPAKTNTTLTYNSNTNDLGATKFNGMTLTASTGTFTLTNAKTLSVTNTLTLSGTDSTTMTFPTTSATIARTDAGQTFTGVNTFTSPKIITDISDTNGNEVFKITATGSAVNEITVANAATGNAPSLTSTGGDTNIDLNIGAKGTGEVKHTTATYQDVVTATDGATVTFDMSDGNYQKVTLGGNRTLALSNVKTGQVFMLNLIQDGTGSRTVTWFSGISWSGGSSPTLTTTASKQDVFGFICTGAGAYLGFIVGQNC